MDQMTPGRAESIFQSSASKGGDRKAIPSAVGSSGSARVAGTIGKLPGPGGGHGAAVSDSGDVYIAQLSGKIEKFVKE